jgi:hypothetical protein
VNIKYSYVVKVFFCSKKNIGDGSGATVAVTFHILQPKAPTVRCDPLVYVHRMKAIAMWFVHVLQRKATSLLSEVAGFPGLVHRVDL